MRNAARLLRGHCDTFYGIPNENSFYVFTGIQPLTGMLANGGPAGLTGAQQQQVLDALERKLRTGERVCVMRHPYPFVTPTPRTPLGRLLKQFNRVVASSGTYTIARHR